MELSGKTALITGGSSGIGLATAQQLSRRGVRCALMARDPERLEAAIATLEPDRAAHLVLPANVSDPQAVAQALEQLQRAMGAPDILINCAGVTQPGYAQVLDLEIYRYMMEVNYFGAVNLTKAVLPGMLARRSGYIVNVASVAAFVSIFGYTAYGASKFALRGYSDALRHEMKPHGIRVAIVYPPDTDTPQLVYENLHKPPELKMLLPELGTLQPEQIAQAIVDGIQHNKQIILPDFGTRLIYLLVNLLGSHSYTVLDLLLRRARRHLPHPTTEPPTITS